MTSSTTTLYEKLGAEEGIAGAVDVFYERVTSDPALAGYFAGVDMAALRRHQAAMLSAAAGGPRPYTGRSMAEAHGDRAITDSAFDAVVAHLGATLATAGASDETIGAVVAALAPLRSSIVTA
ncbi:group I truncated hemoglobin [Nakamurella sp. GG22]